MLRSKFCRIHSDGKYAHWINYSFVNLLAKVNTCVAFRWFPKFYLFGCFFFPGSVVPWNGKIRTPWAPVPYLELKFGRKWETGPLFSRIESRRAETRAWDLWVINLINELYWSWFPNELRHPYLDIFIIAMGRPWKNLFPLKEHVCFGEDCMGRPKG